MSKKFSLKTKSGGLWARLTALMVVFMMTATQVNAQQPSVSYLDKNGATQTTTNYTLVGSSATAVTWAAGTYVVGADYNSDGVIDATDATAGENSFTIIGGAKAASTGNINLILVDGFTLTLDASESVRTAGFDGNSNNNRVSIYGQESQTGTLIGKGGKAANGITSLNNQNGFFINGGIIKGYGGDTYYGPFYSYGDKWQDAGNGIYRVTVNGGSVYGYGGDETGGATAGFGLSRITLNDGRIEGHGGNGNVKGGGGDGVDEIVANGGEVYGYGGNGASGKDGGLGVDLTFDTSSLSWDINVSSTVYGKGGNGKLGGDGIYSEEVLTVYEGAKITGIGGDGVSDGNGIGGTSLDVGMGDYDLTINGGTVTATGGSGTSDGWGIAAKPKYAATNLTVKYGTDASFATILEREGTDFSGVGYAKYVKVYNTTFIVTCEGNDETTPNSLKKALAEIEAGDIIQLGADINLTGTMNVTSNHNFILDLNGHVLQRPNNATTDFSVITNNGILTIIDSSEGKTGKIMGGTGTDVAGTKIGGGIYNMGWLTVNDITIEGNSATKGGGIYNCRGLILNDGTVITGNTTTGNNLSAGVYCQNDDSEITLNGKVIIKDNLSNGIVGNLCLNNINIDRCYKTMTEGAVIGVSPLNNDVFVPRVFAEEVTSSDTKYFISDNNRYHVIFYEDDSLKLEAHKWHYIAKDNVLYAYCETESCPHYGTTENLEKAVTYTLVADNMNYSGEQYNGASLVDGGWAELGLTAPTTIEYAGRGATEYQKTTTPPTEIGLYTASVTKTIEPSNSEIVATANFQIKPQITFGCDEGKSVVVLNGETELQSGDFADMEYQITAVAEPKANFHKWTAGPDGEELSTANPYIFSITQNTVLYGRFNVEINVEANPAEGGNVAIKYTNGDYIVGDACKNITYGASVTIEATSNEGYAFQGWFDTTTGEIFSKTQKLTFDALNSKNLEARFTDQVIWVRVKKGN